MVILKKDKGDNNMDKESIFAAMETIRQERAEGEDVNRGTFKATTSDDGMMT